MLSSVFNYLRGRFYSVAYWFSSIGNWLDGHGTPWKYLSPYFYSVRDLFTTIGGYFYEAYTFTKSIEDVLDDAWTKAKQVFNYVYDVLVGRIYDALNAASHALERAIDAAHEAAAVWDYATGWLRDRANEAWARAGNVWGSVTDWLKEQAIAAYNKAVWAYEQIGAAITAAIQEIHDWGSGILAEIDTFVEGIVATIKTWAAGAIEDVQARILSIIAAPFNLVNLWFDDIQDFFNDPLSWLESKFGDWFFGKEK